jgi:heat shock protein HslJ
MPRIMPCLALVATSACVGPAASGGIDGTWHLIGVDFQPALAPLTITFDTDGGFSGKAPCNQFFGKVSGSFPAITLGNIGATKMACPDLAVESLYFEALSAMQSAEISEGHLFLSGFEGRVIEFTRDPEGDGTCLSCLAAQ